MSGVGSHRPTTYLYAPLSSLSGLLAFSKFDLLCQLLKGIQYNSSSFPLSLKVPNKGATPLINHSYDYHQIISSFFKDDLEYQISILMPSIEFSISSKNLCFKKFLTHSELNEYLGNNYVFWENTAILQLT